MLLVVPSLLWYNYKQVLRIEISLQNKYLSGTPIRLIGNKSASAAIEMTIKRRLLEIAWLINHVTVLLNDQPLLAKTWASVICLRRAACLNCLHFLTDKKVSELLAFKSFAEKYKRSEKIIIDKLTLETLERLNLYPPQAQEQKKTEKIVISFTLSKIHNPSKWC